MTAKAPLRVVQVGAGAMGAAWLRTVTDSSDVELAGVVDLDPELARTAARLAGHDGVAVGTSVREVIDRVRAQAVINVTVPTAHHDVTREALFAGLQVLSEKPIAPTVAEGLAMVAAAELTGSLLMVSQSRRYVNTFEQYRRVVGDLGQVGVVACEFFRAPHFGGFREEMADPLLVDMAIHHFDAARYLVGQDPVAVYCESHNPAWSWYAGDAVATAIFELSGGARYVYTGSWCSPAQETSWNGRWRVSAERGTATWDGDHSPVVATADGPVDAGPAADGPEEIAGALAEFVDAVRTGTEPSGAGRANVLSLAMVESAVRSASTRRRVEIAEILAEAHDVAVRAEHRDDVRSVLTGWPDVRTVVGLPG